MGIPRFRLYCFWVGIILLLASCSAPETKVCISDNVCGKQEICEEGACIQGCRTNDNCPAEHFCRDKKCTRQICKPGEKQECYEGPEDTKGKGACAAGEKLCLQDGSKWSPCYSQQLPVQEVCDNSDNDCDGKTDEDLKCDCEPGQLRLCYSGGVQTDQVGLCKRGVQYCNDKRLWGECRDQVLPRPEICDGFDNDCNGEIDDNINCDCKPGTERECYSGKAETSQVGRCRKGRQVCTDKGVWSACKNQVMPDLEEFQRPEICNGNDDNCDGLVDNVSGKQEPLKRECYSGEESTLRKGSCTKGLQTCQNGQWGGCMNEVIPKQEECNGKDDDCDGIIDNNIKPRPCTTSKEGCTPTSSGAYQCLGRCKVGEQKCEQGTWSSCTGEVKPTAQEVCGNSQDDDCNGEIDDNCVCKNGDTRSCYTGSKETKGRGICTEGKQTCENNSWGSCIGEGAPQSEVCNGKDDDCDGEVDNFTTTCKIPGKEGRCALGTQVCEQGKKICKPQAVVKEVCNDEDDDCDGIIDNIPDRGTSCVDNVRSGVCAQGKWQCVNKQKVCVATIKPGSLLETCNQKDDDCDGLIDNVKGACTVSGQQGACTTGVWTCSGTTKTCQQSVQQTQEICNGKDDDCNGVVDDIVDLNDPCMDKARFGICRAGQWRCVSQKKACVQVTQAKSKEECNKLDDDCDGSVDEGCNNCQTNQDCPTSSFCINGFCVVGNCLTDADCKSGQVCRNLKCISCSTNSDCPVGKYCDKGTCKIFQCQVNSQCPRGQICNSSFRCSTCTQDSECGTGRVCRSGVCYQSCTATIDCSSNEACNTNKLCYKTCTQDSECDKGFGCATTSRSCLISVVLDQGAYKWSDNSYPSSCTPYRFGTAGHKPSQISGAYWIRSTPKGTPFRVYCDMTSDGGGWTLLAKYNSQLYLQGFDFNKHQVQGKTTSSNPTQTPDLSTPTVFGHLKYTLWNPANTEVKMDCQKSPSGSWFSRTSHRWFNSWTPGLRGIYGTDQKASRYHQHPGWAMIAKNGVNSRLSTLCGVSSDISGTSGLAYCNGVRGTSKSYFPSNMVAFSFTRAGVMTIGCNGSGMLNGRNGQWSGRVWIRVRGSNPVVETSGVRKWKNGTVARSCLEYQQSVGGQYTGQTGSGVYQIQPDPKLPSFPVFCDMRTRGGGWTLAFIKNTRSGKVDLRKALLSQSGVSSLAYSPEESAHSNSSRQGWLDFTSFPYDTFYLGVYDKAPSKINCPLYDDSCSGLYGTISKSKLSQPLGSKPFFLTGAAATDLGPTRYFWVAGDVLSTTRVLGRDTSSIGYGWHVALRSGNSGAYFNHMTLCGTGSNASNCPGMTRYIPCNNTSCYRTYGQRGTAIAVWVK